MGVFSFVEIQSTFVTLSSRSLLCQNWPSKLQILSDRDSDLMTSTRVSSQSADSNLGRVLSDRYCLMTHLGSGSMGRVYLAQDRALANVPVAVKLLASAIADDLTRTRFEREAKACALLSHKSSHVVRVSDYGITPEGTPFFVMEYLQGNSLQDLLQTGPLSLDRCLRLGRHMAMGLKAAHDGIEIDSKLRQVIHRDLKPANVLVVPDESLGEVAKIVDFGIAKLLSESGAATITSAYIGTLAYSSPEQLEGLPLDPRSDLYSYGIVLYQMISAKLPVRAQTGSFPGWYQAHRKQQPLPLSAPALLAQSVPPGLSQLVAACLEKKPENRPQSAAEIVTALDAISLAAPATPAAGAESTFNTNRASQPILKKTLLSPTRLKTQAQEKPQGTQFLQPPKASAPNVSKGFAWLGCCGLAFAFLLLTFPRLNQPNEGALTTTSGQSTSSEFQPTDLKLLDPPRVDPSPTPAEVLPSSSPLPSDLSNQSPDPPIALLPPNFQTFPVGTPYAVFREHLGEPANSGRGYWPNTDYALYHILPDRLDLGLIYDRDTLLVRQTEASFADEVPDDVLDSLLRDMLQFPVPTELQTHLAAVRNRSRDRVTFFYPGQLEGVIERNSQGRVYLGAWEPDLH